MRAPLVPIVPRAAAIAAFSLATLATFTVAAPLSAQEGPTSTLDGVYTAEQAARGRETYVKVCSRCHALDWYKGDVVRAWEGAPVYNLFEVISTTMPEDNPGSLRRREYLDMMAYILELNGMPPGQQELPVGASRLRQILFEWRNLP